MGVHIDTRKEEFSTGLMERVVDGPQQASWAPGLKESMNLRGRKSKCWSSRRHPCMRRSIFLRRGYGLFV